MSHIYREKREIPIPENGYINKSDGRVFVFVPSDSSAKKRDCKRMNIGIAASQTTMYVNDNFRFFFPELWEKHYGGSDEKMQYVLHPGMYALTLGIGYSNGLYPLLLDVFGPSPANLIMDYSMYSIMDQSNVSLGYQDRMSSEVLFSHKGACSDTMLSSFFSHAITDNQSYDFRCKWLDLCVARGVTQAWISIDGSNNDCSSTRCALAEKGDAKSKLNINIVSYMYAVCAETGLPLTYDVYHGNSVDNKSFHKVIELLSGHNIEIKGIILDRGFATDEVLNHIRSLHYPFVVMLKSDSFGYSDMLDRHWSDIKVKVDRAINTKGQFGITEQHRIFKGSAKEDYVTLFYDMDNGTARAHTLLNKVLTAKQEIDRQTSLGIKPEIPSEVARYFEVISNADGSFSVSCKYDIWQHDVDMKGFSAIGTSENFGPAETDRIYDLRNSSEVQYSYIKTQMGSDVSRVHSTDSVLNKFTVCFVSSIIRNEIQHNCKQLGLPTNPTIKEIDRLEILLQPGRNYIAIHNESKRAKLLLGRFDIIPKDFDIIAAEVTERFANPVQSLERKKPVHEATARKPGRPKGSGKKKSRTDGDVPVQASLQEQDTADASRETSTVGTVAKRPPGRPKGSKNKKTLEFEQKVREGKIKLPAKRKRGRPAGSKNKPKDQKDPATEGVKRKPGRPKGSKNKPVSFEV